MPGTRGKDECPGCGGLKQTNAMRCQKCMDARYYIPTPEEIRKAAAEIKAKNLRVLADTKNPR